MVNKRKIKRNLIEIISHFSLNWENKAKLVKEIIETSPEAFEIFLGIIENNSKMKNRKGAASIISYLDSFSACDQLVEFLFKEKEWSVRYAISTAIKNHLGKESSSLIKKRYNELLNDETEIEKSHLKIILIESLGVIGNKEDLPILTAHLDEIDFSNNITNQVLVKQIIYSIGEISDVSSVPLLLKYSARNQFTTTEIQASATHALEKIAKKNGFASKKKLLEHLNSD